MSFHSSDTENWLKQLNERMEQALVEQDELLKNPQASDSPDSTTGHE